MSQHKLSNTASTYLQSLHRNEVWAMSDKQALLDYFQGQGIAPIECIIEAQLAYSGYELRLFQKPLDTFKISIFTKEDLALNAPINFHTFDHPMYLHCGEHATAQVSFYIDPNGRICSDGDDEDAAHPLYASFEQMLECYALKDKLLRDGFEEHPPYFKLINLSMFERLTQDFLPDANAQDAFNRWLYGRDLILQLGQWLHEPTFYLHIYGKDQKQCAAFVEKLQNQQVIA